MPKHQIYGERPYRIQRPRLGHLWFTRYADLHIPFLSSKRESLNWPWEKQKLQTSPGSKACDAIWKLFSIHSIKLSVSIWAPFPKQIQSELDEIQFWRRIKYGSIRLLSINHKILRSRNKLEREQLIKMPRLVINNIPPMTWKWWKFIVLHEKVALLNIFSPMCSCPFFLNRLCCTGVLSSFWSHLWPEAGSWQFLLRQK